VDWVSAQALPTDPSQQAAYLALLNAETEQTLIMQDRPEVIQRVSQVFDRGNWLVKTDTVQPGTPGILPAMPADAFDNRLGLAQWMTHPDHPLTGRTIVNRIWEQLFGIGLVETLEDLGTQGEKPTHPALLDALTYHFTHDDGWKLKRLIKTLALSATYRQQSTILPALQERDPRNQLYARGPRVRLSAEQIRDQTLAVAGLLSLKQGGPSVMPYQPEGIWVSPYNGAKWVISEGEDRYRRAVYTYFRRSNPYPAFLTFDATDREVCTARRIRTNTPLQALVTLNDPSYLEAAQHFSQRMYAHAGAEASPAQLIRAGLGLMMVEEVSDKQVALLLTFYQQALTDLQDKPEQVVAVQTTLPQQRTPEAAALTLVANAMLNLDVFLTKA
jgi:hypothetical protein